MATKKDKSTLDEYEAGLQREREAQADTKKVRAQLGVNPFAPEPDMSDDELGNGSDDHKEYMVHRDGTVINGELLNQGDYVTLHPDVAKRHTDADVRLTEVKHEA